MVSLADPVHVYVNQSIISLLTYDKTHMLTLNTELQYKKSQYESLYSMRIKKFLSAKCPVHVRVCGVVCVMIYAACVAGKFGFACLQDCRCTENSNCDHVTGDCICKPGHTGIDCARGRQQPSPSYE